MTQIHKKYKRRFQVVNKMRLVICLSILLVIIYPAIMFAVDKPTAIREKSFISVYIEHGDTLWNIAKANLPPKTDIRDFIYEIKVANQLDSALIKEGDSLMVPLHP